MSSEDAAQVQVSLCCRAAFKEAQRMTIDFAKMLQPYLIPARKRLSLLACDFVESNEKEVFFLQVRKLELVDREERAPRKRQTSHCEFNFQEKICQSFVCSLQSSALQLFAAEVAGTPHKQFRASLSEHNRNYVIRTELYETFLAEAYTFGKEQPFAILCRNEQTKPPKSPTTVDTEVHEPPKNNDHVE